MRRFYLDSYVYHTTSVTRGRRRFFADSACAAVLLSAVDYVRRGGRVFVLAYAVMPDHLHLLLAPGQGSTVSSIMHSIKLRSSREINRLVGESGPVWQQSYYDRMIRDDAHLEAAIEYIERNPVIEGLASTPEEYPFSSAYPGASVDREAFTNG